MQCGQGMVVGTQVTMLDPPHLHQAGDASTLLDVSVKCSEVTLFRLLERAMCPVLSCNSVLSSFIHQPKQPAALKIMHLIQFSIPYQIAGLSPSCFASDPASCQCTWKGRRWPKYVNSTINMEDADGVPSP